MQLKVKRLSDDAQLPFYAHPRDSGLDLFSTEDKVIYPGEIGLIPTGISIELPPNTEAQVRPRSGLAIKNGITVLNTPGTVDNGYRDEVKVIIINHGSNWFRITKGMKIAQLVICPVYYVEVIEVEELSDTVRGLNGFGSTGV